MIKVVGVRFKENGKMYYFDPKGLDIKSGDWVVVETARCVECGFASEALLKLNMHLTVPKSFFILHLTAELISVNLLRTLQHHSMQG